MGEAGWHYGEGGKPVGPVAETTLLEMIRVGKVGRGTLVWRAGMAEWKAASAVPELAGAFPPPPIPPPAGAPPPAPMPGTSDGAGEAAIRMLIPIGRSPWAIAAGYSGLLALFPVIGMVPAVLGIVFGVLAIRQIRANKSLHGLGRAWFGIIAGGLCLVGWCVLLAAVAMN